MKPEVVEDVRKFAPEFGLNWSEPLKLDILC